MVMVNEVVVINEVEMREQNDEVKKI